jgi:hypothetical protein
MNGGRGTRSAGYTIVETLIFLAVSASMFIMAMAFLNGRQATAEFNTAVRNFDSEIQDVANDVSDGYYSNLAANGETLTCKADLALGTDDSEDKQGANKDCLFIGKSIWFSPGTGANSFSLITLVGKRLSGAEDVTSLAESGVKAAAKTSSIDTTPDTTTKIFLNNDATVDCVIYGGVATDPPCSSGTKIDTISFISTFRSDITSSASSQVNVAVPANASPANRSIFDAVGELNGYSTEGTFSQNPPGGVTICLQSAGTKQYALIKLAGQNGQFVTTTTINSGRCNG